jgi:hypothetical protein
VTEILILVAGPLMVVCACAAVAVLDRMGGQ